MCVSVCVCPCVANTLEIASLKVADWEVLPMITCAVGETGLWMRLSRILSPRLCHNTRGSKPEVRLLSPSKSPFP